MKKLYSFIILLVCIFQFSIAQDLENSSFENWEDFFDVNGNFLYEEPSDYWATNNLVSTINSETGPFVTRETERVQEGNSALKLVSGYLTGFGGGLPVGALCGVGEFNLNFADQFKSYAPGMPFTAQPETLTGYFIYEPVDIEDEGTIIKDACEIYTYLTKFSNNKRDTLAVAYYSTEDTFSDFQYLEIPFEYFSTEIPDSMFTVFAASKLAAPPLYYAGIGSTLIVDNFSFDYNVGISTPVVPLYEINVFPNPTSNFITFKFEENKNFELSIFNTEGKLITKTNISIVNNTIDTSCFSEGNYFYTINEQGKTVAGGQFLVKH